MGKIVSLYCFFFLVVVTCIGCLDTERKVEEFRDSINDELLNKVRGMSYSWFLRSGSSPVILFEKDDVDYPIVIYSFSDSFEMVRTLDSRESKYTLSDHEILLELRDINCIGMRSYDWGYVFVSDVSTDLNENDCRHNNSFIHLAVVSNDKDKVLAESELDVILTKEKEGIFSFSQCAEPSNW